MKVNPNFTHLYDKIEQDRVILLQGGTRCFVGSTLVMAEHGPKKIEDIKIGDKVYSWSGSQQVLRNVVNKFIYKSEQSCHKLVKFTFINNETIECTYGHKFLYQGQYVEAINIAKRAMERSKEYGWPIYGKQLGPINGYELQEDRKGKDYETFGNGRIHENNDIDKREIFNGKGPQISRGGMGGEQFKQTTSKSHKPQQVRQSGHKLGMGNASRECGPYDELQQAIHEQWGQEWYGQDNRRYSKGNPERVHAQNCDGQTFSTEIQFKGGPCQRNSANENLGPCEITDCIISAIDFIEYNGPVIDIEVQEYHNYFVTNQKIITHNSGKTYSTILFLIDYCLQYKGMEIDIVRDTFTALKSTAWKDFRDVLITCNLYKESNHNKTDHEYELNGNIISYYGADTPAKIHGRARDILWVNEAHQFPAETIDQLFPRTRHKIIADYNPALGLEHWLDTYIEQYPPCITTYKDNPYLTDAQIQDIESRKGNQYWWQVYGSGQRANREGAIFTNWITGDFDNSLPYCYGQDYGFSVDPTTLVKVAVDKKNKKIYVDECFYNKNQLGTEAIYELNKAHLLKPSDLIIADSAEPRLIDELRRKGLNIRGAIKGQGSVTAGITQMQDYQIIVTERSINTRKELSNYCWNDKKAGIPIDDYNHVLDPIRYTLKELTQTALSLPKHFANR
jgi:PBSX family phage terminase large subunit